MTTENLAESLKIVLASAFNLYLNTHFAHWNIQSPLFYELHKMLEEQYGEIYESVDAIAEKLRQLGVYAPGGLRRYLDLSVLEDFENVPAAMEMVAKLSQDHFQMKNILNQAFVYANQANEQGVCNFLASRIEAHDKHRWFLDATLKR